MIDSPQEVISNVLNYLGKDPYSSERADLDAAAQVLTQLRPNLRYVGAGRHINDLAKGEICLALTCNGDAYMAADNAREAQQPFEVQYRIPREGTLLWFSHPGYSRRRAASQSGPCLYRLHAASEFIAAQIRARAGDSPVYLTFDIDYLDRAFAPGTGTPVRGGLSTHQTLEILRGINVVGMDVVEVSPPWPGPSWRWSWFACMPRSINWAKNCRVKSLFISTVGVRLGYPRWTDDAWSIYRLPRFASEMRILRT